MRRPSVTVGQKLELAKDMSIPPALGDLSLHGLKCLGDRKSLLIGLSVAAILGSKLHRRQP
jgi:hypothetical protein